MQGVSCGGERYAGEGNAGEGKGLTSYRISLIRAALHSPEVSTGFPAPRLVGD